jgi:hypothetical protein
VKNIIITIWVKCDNESIAGGAIDICMYDCIFIISTLSTISKRSGWLRTVVSIANSASAVKPTLKRLAFFKVY